LSSLPFLTTGELLEQGGDAVEGAEAVPVSVWPATAGRNSAVGRHHTHAGEAALEHAAALRVPNRSLEVEGELYKIVGATANDFVPHVVLELLLTSGRS
jgi:hypothetical protein